MPSPSLLGQLTHPQKDTRFAPIWTERFMNGYFPNRNILRSPLSAYYSEGWHLGATDAIMDGLNVELSERQTIIRRPGCPAWTTATFPTPPLALGNFIETNGTYRVLVDIADTLYYADTTSKTTIFSKSSGAGRGYWQGIAQTLYYGDGVDNIKWNDFGSSTPGNGVWNHGIVAPTNAPNVTITPSGSAAVQWTASTFYSTMGLLNDGNGGIWQLTSVNGSGINTTQLGSTGDGQPNFDLTIGSTTTDNGGMGSGGVTWTSWGQLQLWTANTSYAAGQCIFVPNVGGSPEPDVSGAGNNVTFPGTQGGGIFQAYIGGFTGSGHATSLASPPRWNPTTNTHTNDGSIEWQYLGPAQLWEPGEVYNSWWEHYPQVICYPTLPNQTMLQTGTQTIYVLTANNQTTGHNNTPGTSGTGYSPQWATITTIGQTLGDGDLIWQYLGSNAWASNTTYVAWTAGSPTFSAIIDGNGNLEVCITGGQSGTTAPLNKWKPSHAYALNDEIAVQSTGGWVLMKVTTAGTSNSTEPVTWNFSSSSTTTDGGVVWTSQGVTALAVWGQNYGSQTSDGGVVWTNVGSAANSTWTTSEQWYLPASGFLPPTTGDPYGGAEVIANNDIQAIITSGLSGSTAPSWAALGNNTTDNTAVWYAVSAATSNGISWSFFHNFCYAYKSRAATDSYVTTAPPGLSSPLGTPTGSASGGVSSPSPAYIMVNGATNGTQVVTLSGIGSTDPQVDTISIFATADGGSIYLWATDIPNPPPVNGQAQPWSFQYYLPDNATNTGTQLFPGLNILVQVVPSSGVNNPPPTGAINHTLHLGRLFVSIGNTVYASAGPDVGNPGQPPGNPYEAFPPLRNWVTGGTVIKLMSQNSGLLVFTTNGLWQIVGGPSATSLVCQIAIPDINVVAPGDITERAGMVYVYTADRRMITLDPSTGVPKIGKPVGNELQLNFNPGTVTLAHHVYGDWDDALYVANGSTGWLRCVPNMAPDGAITGPVWSPPATIVGGCGVIASVYQSAGSPVLLIGGTANDEPILMRDSTFTTFSDNGTAYDANFTIGAIVLAHPGQMAECGFITCDYTKVGTQPSVSWLANEINTDGGATFTNISGYIVGDPPKLFGMGQPTSVYSDRYYFNQTVDDGYPPPAYCRWMLVNFDFGNDTVMNEMLSFTIFGALLQEK